MKIIKLFVISMILLMSSMYAHASDTVRLVLFAAPGSLVHKYALQIQNKISSVINKTVVIEFKVGAEGMIAAEYLHGFKNSDSLVLMMGTAQRWDIISNRYNLNLIDSFKIVSFLGYVPGYVITGKHREITTLSEFLVKSKTEKISYGLSMNNPARPLLRELFNTYGNPKNVEEIVYKSGSQSLIDTINHTLDFAISSPHNTGIEEMISSGKLSLVTVLSKTPAKDFPIRTVYDENIKIENPEKYHGNIYMWANNDKNANDIIKIQKEIQRILLNNEVKEVSVDIKDVYESEKYLQRVLK